MSVGLSEFQQDGRNTLTLKDRDHLIFFKLPHRIFLEKVFEITSSFLRCAVARALQVLKLCGMNNTLRHKQ